MQRLEADVGERRSRIWYGYISSNSTHDRKGCQRMNHHGNDKHFFFLLDRRPIARRTETACNGRKDNTFIINLNRIGTVHVATTSLYSVAQYIDEPCFGVLYICCMHVSWAGNWTAKHDQNEWKYDKMPCERQRKKACMPTHDPSVWVDRFFFFSRVSGIPFGFSWISF
jgi:hypothetical protein